MVLLVALLLFHGAPNHVPEELDAAVLVIVLGGDLGPDARVDAVVVDLSRNRSRTPWRRYLR